MNYDLINVERYDSDRIIPSRIQKKTLEFISKKFPSNKYPLLFEPGIGTGRWAIPLAGIGYNVFGIDISEKMLCKLKSKLSNRKDINIRYELGNIYSIGSPNNYFDICFISHLFHLLEDLEKAVIELLRVLKTSGILLYIKGGKGKAIPELSALYCELLKIYGVNIIPFREKIQYAFNLLKESGFHQYDISEESWKWDSRLKISEGLKVLKYKSFSFTNIVNQKTHLEIMEAISKTCIQKYGSLEKELEVHNHINLSIFQKELT